MLRFSTAVLVLLFFGVTAFGEASAYAADEERPILLRGHIAEPGDFVPTSPAALRAALVRPVKGWAAPTDDRVDPWFSFDKVQHFTFSFLFTVGWQYGFENKLDWSRNDALPASIGATLAIGLAKELYDWRLGPRRFFSYRDMVANSAGILLATGFILL